MIRHRLFNIIQALIFLVLLSACEVYQSPDRLDFESQNPAELVVPYQKLSCSPLSLAEKASQSRLVAFIDEEHPLWEHIVDSVSYYESVEISETKQQTNATAQTEQNQYCLYAVKKVLRETIDEK